MIQREYTWSSIFAWGLTLSGAALATSGVIGMFWPELDIGWICIIAFACMMAFGIGLVNCAAAAALQAIKHRKPDGSQTEWAVFLPALACCIGFTFATNVGVHLGWEIVTANAPAGAKLPATLTIDAVFYIFAFAKPAMAWIVEGRKAMDAEDYTALQTRRRREAAEMAEAEAARDAAREMVKLAARDAAQDMVEPVVETISTAPGEAGLEIAAPVAETPVVSEQLPEEAPKPRAKREKRRPRTIEEQRAAAMKSAARRVAAFREQYGTRVHAIEEARADLGLTPLDIARACDRLIERGEKPTIRRVAEVLGVSQMRVEKTWPQGVPLDGTGEFRAA